MDGCDKVISLYQKKRTYNAVWSSCYGYPYHIANVPWISILKIISLDANLLRVLLFFVKLPPVHHIFTHLLMFTHICSLFIVFIRKKCPILLMNLYSSVVRNCHDLNSRFGTLVSDFSAPWIWKLVDFILHIYYVEICHDFKYWTPAMISSKTFKKWRYLNYQFNEIRLGSRPLLILF